MAIELIARIMSRPRSELDPAEKWVLVVMADRADDDGLLWYAVDTIAARTSYTPRGVQNVVDRLIKKGFVKKMPRQNRSNFWLINVDRLPMCERERKAKETGPIEFIESANGVEDDLFGTGEPRSGTGERRSVTGEPGSATGERRAPDSLSDSLSDSLTPSTREDALVEGAVQGWNAVAGEFELLAAVRGPVSPQRRAAIVARTNEHAKANGGDEALWAAVLATIADSKLLTGQKTSWAATFDWVLGKKNFAKIIGGNYGHGHDCIGRNVSAPDERSAMAAASAARELVDRARGRSAAGGSGGRGGGASLAH